MNSKTLKRIYKQIQELVKIHPLAPIVLVSVDLSRYENFMFILVTNDDGYDAPGLWVAYDLAHKLGGKNARVCIVAPKSEQSGVGHAMSYNSPIRVEKVRDDHFLVHGTPTDCVILSSELFEETPDLLISGVNRGHNLGPDALYSGTVGAAIEATAYSIPAIALSQFYGQKGEDEYDQFATARSHGLKALTPIWNKYKKNWPVGRFCNINFPACSSENVKGVKMVQAEPLSRSNMIAHERQSPNGDSYYWLGHPGPLQARQKGCDVEESKAGYVTASFMNLDLGDREFTQENLTIFDNE